MIAAVLTFTSAALYAITGTVTPDGVTVENSHYKIFFDKKSGYTPVSVTVNGKKFTARGGAVVWFDGEPETYQKRYPASEKPVYASAMKTEPTVLENSADRFVVIFDRSFNGGTLKEKITFDNTEKITFELDFSYQNRPFMMEYPWSFWSISGSNGQGLFYPGARRDVAIRADYPWRKAPNWNYFYNSDLKFGFGMIAPVDGKDTAVVIGNTQSSFDGFDSDITMQKATTNQLRYKPVPGTSSMKFHVLCGNSTPEKAAEIAQTVLPEPQDFAVEDLWIEKLAVKKGGKNKVSAKLVNNTASARNVKVSVVCEYGLMKSFVIAPEETVTVPANSSVDYAREWNFPGDVEYGATVKLVCNDNGKKIVKEDYCGASDSRERVVGYGICTPSFCHQEGSEKTWADAWKRNYIGLIEFYTWTKSTIGGLAPEDDKWQPHTELEGMTSSVVTISKKFLQNFVKNAHDNGVMVYAWITGLVNYHYGLQNPEHIQYSANGQPCVYDGKIHKGKRFSVFKANAFSEEFAAKWGDEMADSVDMFGWDGCRWDWNFVPDLGNDPMLHSIDTRDWYDHRGIPGRQLYKDADKVAAKAAKAWIDAVQKRHPDFQYGTNYSARQALVDRYPEHTKQMSDNSLILLEFLISVWHPDRATFPKWAKELQDARERLRAGGCMPTVGTMYGLANGSYSKRMSHYISAAAGVRYWGYASFGLFDSEYEVNRYFTRFSEFYFNPDFAPMAENLRKAEVKVDGHERVYSDILVYERKNGKKRDVTVHLVNLPDNGDYFCQRQVPPPVRKNTVVSVKPRQGEKLKKVFAAAPFTGKERLPGMVELPVSGNSVTLPELDQAAVLVFQFEVK